MLHFQDLSAMTEQRVCRQQLSNIARSRNASGSVGLLWLFDIIITAHQDKHVHHAVRVQLQSSDQCVQQCMQGGCAWSVQ